MHWKVEYRLPRQQYCSTFSALVYFLLSHLSRGLPLTRQVQNDDDVPQFINDDVIRLMDENDALQDEEEALEEEMAELSASMMLNMLNDSPEMYENIEI